MTVTTRFAPSPTGYLHIGGVRTALFSWLYAKKLKGKFLLRIEDTDLERSTQASVDAIMEGMAWLGLHSDETPIHQSQRFDRYKAVVQQLIDNGDAYKCYCSKERLEALREAQIAAGEKPRYDGHCRQLKEAQEGSHVIRFKNPTEGEVTFDDVVYGTITFQNSELDDLVIIRSDGAPTYHMTVVVDDTDTGITHVIRGNDHLNNTPRQINILKAMGAAIPTYAHVPMILGSDGKRMSKRHGAVSVMHYKEEGFLPEAMLNFLVRLGWSHGDQEIFSLEEMVELFDTQHIHKSPAGFNIEKLEWLNQHYLKTLPVARVAEVFKAQCQHMGVDCSGVDIEAVVMAQRERAKTLKEMVEKSQYLFEDVDQYDEAAVAKHVDSDTSALLSKVAEALSNVATWNQEALHEAIQALLGELSVKMPKLAQPVRIAVTGNTISPSLDVTLALLGKEKTLVRLKRAVERFAA